MRGSLSAKVSPYARSKMFAGPPPLGDRMGLADRAGDPGGVRVAAAYARASSFAAAASRLATSSAVSSGAFGVHLP